MKTEAIISHIWADTILGKSFRININHLQLCFGLETPIFESQDDIGYLPENWLTHIRNYIHEINGTLQIKKLLKPSKLREQDKILMTAFLSLGLSNTELKLVNNWRIYFQINTLSELCNPEGACIQSCFFKNRQQSQYPRVNSSKLQWPQQGMPGKRGFSLWLKCLRSCFNMDHNGRINYRFGTWASCEVLIKNNDWLFFIQPSSGILFSKI
jgi:hypothetical protein